MPIYKYKAITSNGVIVTNTIEESSKYLAIKKLKRNNLVPINVEKSLQRAKSKRAVRKNNGSVEDLLKNIDTTNLVLNRQKSKSTYFDKIYHTITKSERIKTRDIVIFTQNFYLLKKANFNNIHALNTIIDSTENFTFKGILEDILAGVEARRKHVYYNGILWRCISISLYKYDKGWRAFRKLNKCTSASSRVSR